MYKRQRVILFAFGRDFPHSIHLPENYNDSCVASVSYTHLDVYKRQDEYLAKIPDADDRLHLRTPSNDSGPGGCR